MYHRGSILPQYGDPHRGVSVARYNIFNIASAHNCSLLLAILAYDLSLKHTYHNVERQRQHKQQTERQHFNRHILFEVRPALWAI